MALYYISPSGNDSNSGTYESPRFSLEAGLALTSPGDTLYVRGGTYQFPGEQTIINKDGTAGNTIKVWAFPGEYPIFTRSASYTPEIGVQTDLIYMDGCSYIHFKGIDISGYSQHPTLPYWFAFRGMDMANCTFESLNYHHNGGAFTLRGDGTTGNLIVNCDFHHNQDPYSDTPYDGADGLNITFVNNTAATNTVRGCRAWWNADDGFDFWQNEGYVLIEQCWAWHNGYIPDTFTTAGNGSGFKLGPCSAVTTLRRTVQNCIAYKNRQWGIVENDSPVAMNIYNNTCLQNGTLNFLFGFWSTPYPKTFRNNISYDSGTLFGETWHMFGTDAVHSNNTWDSAVSLSYADFVNTDDTQLDDSRQADGSLPVLTFLQLANGSDLINAGTNVGLPYSGAAPDMGWYEHTGNVYFLAPTGNDTTGNGSYASPWFSLNKAWTVVAAGDIIYMRGGTYTHTVQQYLTGKNGSVGNYIKIQSYPGEYASITRGATFDKSAGYHKGMVFATANYIHIKKVRFTGMYTSDSQVDAGLYLFDTNNGLFEQIECDNNVQGVFCEGSYDGNLFLNSDFHDNYSNYDGTNGGNSDGIGYSYNSNNSSLNSVRNCRSWNNGDDGFDSFQCLGFVQYDGCWSWHNGFVYGTSTKAGNGCGFKLGSNFPQPSSNTGVLKRRMQNCLAWDNGDPTSSGGAAGVHINEADHTAEIFNCTFYNNGITGLNFHYNNKAHVLRNVISFGNLDKDVEVSGASSSLTCSYGVSGNSDASSGWTNNVTAADFISVDPTGCDGARGVNGELPVLNFLKLAAGSDMIDTGTNVGLSFNGANPDRGAYEYGASGGSGNTPPTAAAGSDQSITLPTSSVTLSGSGSDPDGSIASYAWTQISGTAATIVSPTSASTSVTGLSTAGIRVFRLTVTDNIGATAYDDITITVNAAPVVVTGTANMARNLKLMGIIASSRVITAPSLVDIDFAGLVNWQETPANTWRLITTGTADFYGGKSASILTGAGYIQYDVTDSGGFVNNNNVGLGLALSNSLVPGDNYDYFIYIEGGTGNYKTYDATNGYVDSGIPAASGDKVRIVRTGTAVAAEYYRGGSWIPVIAFPAATAATLYIYGGGYDIGTDELMVNPKGFGVS